MIVCNSRILTAIETELEGTDYSGYTDLIAQARDVLENSDCNGVDELMFGANTDG